LQLSEHFTLEALSASSTAIRLGIGNTPPDELLPNGRALAEGLEQVQVRLGHPLHHDSGYRCDALNEAIHGKPTSQHKEFKAEDFTCPGFGTPSAIVDSIAASDIQFDQLIAEGTWVHVSFSENPRREVWSAVFQNGKAIYTKRETT